jgi:hypothetical protein
MQKEYNNILDKPMLGKESHVEKEIKMNNIIYIDIKNIDVNSIIFRKGKYIADLNLQYYDIKYPYHHDMEDTLHILCQGIKLSQWGTGTKKYKDCRLPCEKNTSSFVELENKIHMIQKIFSEYILGQNIQNLNQEQTQALNDRNINVLMIKNNKMCKIIKLGSETESTVNVQITGIDQFNDLLMDHRFNRRTSYYCADIILAFACCTYENKSTAPNNIKLSFKPYIKIMEMRYNKAKYLEMSNNRNQIMIQDNVMVL